MEDLVEIPPIPRQLSLEREMKDLVLAAAKFMLGRFQENGLIGNEVGYRDLVRQPDLMEQFIEVFKANLHLAEDIAVDTAGNPAEDTDTMLVCGATLAELERMIVYTCAGKVFAAVTQLRRDDPKKTDNGKKEKFGLFGRLKGSRSKPKKSKMNVGALKLEELRPYLAFSWQLPLLETYAHFMQREHLRELKEALLVLDTAEKLETVAEFDPGDVGRARKIADDRFLEMLHTAPGAIGTISQLGQISQFKSLAGASGDRVWDLFQRDFEFVSGILRLDEDLVWAIGPSIVDVCANSITSLKRLKPAILKLFIPVFCEVFADDSGTLLGADGFAAQFLDAIVTELGEMNVSGELTEVSEGALADVIAMKLETAKPEILSWHADLADAA